MNFSYQIKIKEEPFEINIFIFKTGLTILKYKAVLCGCLNITTRPLGFQSFKEAVRATTF